MECSTPEKLNVVKVVHKRKQRAPLTISISLNVEESETLLSPDLTKSPKLMSSDSARLCAECSICKDDLFSYECEESHLSSTQNGRSGRRHGSVPAMDSDMRPLVVTKCGHLFHTKCINKWFQINREKEMKPCPYCKREMMSNDTKRIYPVFGEE